MSLRNSWGFTLLEIMVALAVLALAMGALIKTASDYTSNQTYLRDRTMTAWVARNVLVQYQLENQWPGVGERKGTLKMGWQEWEWLANISQTEEEKLRRIDVEVRALDSEEDDLITVLSGFLKQPD
ncbi:MAG: type II secretion system minor pseudopilin GspI [Zetaproteobacteria bacterium]|nr:type II secretion system minor pseudopilin GspI [Zetaproteobacteria bacterium]